jgi:protocatechuate 3,4-dioxygenase beta subunit
MHELACTPGQTVGSLFHRALPYLGDNRFVAWGGCATDAAGRAAFFAVTVFARALLSRLLTRAYLSDATLDAARRNTPRR